MAGLRTFAAGKAIQIAQWLGGGKLFPGASGRGEVATGLTRDMKDLLSTLDHLQVLNACRQVYNSFPALSGAIDDKSNAVSGNGWGPQFDGRDIAWGDEAELRLIEHFKVCDVRGQPHNQVENIHLGSVTLDRDGEYFIYLFKTATGYPMQQFLESHRIGNRYHNTSYGDYEVRNGIAYNPQGRPVAYHFLGQDRADDRWISARDIIHVYDPKWFSQGRGVSPIVFGILDWLDVHATRDNEKVAQRMFSALAIQYENETGKPDAFTQRFGKTGTTLTSDDGHTSTPLEEIFKPGMTRYLKIGSKYKAFDMGSRPTMNQAAFEERLLRGCFAAIGWSYEQSLDAGKLGGNTSRRDLTKNQRSVERRQAVLMYPWFRTTNHAVAVFIQLGILLPNPEWYEWTPQLPAKMTADAGNEAKIEQTELLLGVLTMKRFCGRRGEWWLDVRNQGEIEADDLITRVERLHAKHGWPRGVIVNLLSMRGANGVLGVDEMDAETKDGESDDAADETTTKEEAAA